MIRLLAYLFSTRWFDMALGLFERITGLALDFDGCTMRVAPLEELQKCLPSH